MADDVLDLDLDGLEERKEKVLSGGQAVCTVAPLGRGGLEGYSEGERYRFERCKGRNGKYFRVYPENGLQYYETCGPGMFKKYFEIDWEKPVDE